MIKLILFLSIEVFICFFYTLNLFLRGSLKQILEVLLGLSIVLMAVLAFISLGWKWGLGFIALPFFLICISRPFAQILAYKMLGYRTGMDYDSGFKIMTELGKGEKGFKKVEGSLLSNTASMVIKDMKFLVVVLLAIVGLAIAINHYVRVAKPGDQSTGIVVDWVGGKFRSDNFKNYEASAAFSGHAVDILIRYGADIVEDHPQIREKREKAIEYLRKALAATQSVEDDYLRRSHQKLPEEYRRYEESLRLFLRGAETKDLQCFLDATRLYNGFLAFMEKHQNEMKRIK